MDGMESVALFALIVKMAAATVALLLIMFTLRWLNGLNNKGIQATNGFNASLRRIRAEGMSAAVYYGLRFVGICILYGMVMS